MTISRHTIVHIAVDFNTPERHPTTTAIEWFVEELTEFDNVVIALKRSVRPSQSQPVLHIAKSGKVFHFPFFGLPFGLGLSWAMRRAAKRMIKTLDDAGVQPDLVHAHKFTFEGLAGRYVAKHFGVPLFVSLRGEVETKVFRMKPFMRKALRSLAGEASKLYFVSAWFRDEFHRFVPAQPAKEELLPNIVRNVKRTILSQPPSAAFVTVLNLDTWKRKGLPWLLDAVAVAARQDSTIRLDVIGSGSPTNIAHVATMIAKRDLRDIVTLIGKVPNQDLLPRLSAYRGLLLPSLNETFGMVYVEALFAGIPILLTAGTAIDGYLEDLEVGYAVPPRNVPAICAAMLEMAARSEHLRENIANAAPQLFERFDPELLIANYSAEVRRVISAQTYK